jgi:hypothetical protein
VQIGHEPDGPRKLKTGSEPARGTQQGIKALHAQREKQVKAPVMKWIRWRRHQKSKNRENQARGREPCPAWYLPQVETGEPDARGKILWLEEQLPTSEDKSATKKNESGTETRLKNPEWNS